MGSLLQRFLWLIQLRGLALRCLKIVKTLFSFVMLDSDLLFFIIIIPLQLFKDKENVLFSLFFKKVYFLMLINVQVILGIPTLTLKRTCAYITHTLLVFHIFFTHKYL